MTTYQEAQHDDPDAEVLEVIQPLRFGGSWTVRIRCPLCGSTHEHGLGSDGDLWGHRVAHCQTKKLFAGYHIRKPAP